MGPPVRDPLIMTPNRKAAVDDPLGGDAGPRPAMGTSRVVFGLAVETLAGRVGGWRLKRLPRNGKN